MIHVEDLRVRRSGKLICSVAKLEVGAGERVGIFGPNGSGKSTLLLVLAGLDPSAEGRCTVSVPVKDRVYVHQQPILFRGTVLENVMYGLKARGMRAHAAAEQARAWLDRLGVAPLWAQSGDKLSGGERRRVALARALVLRPKLLLLDEPLADLDEEGTRRLTRALSELSSTTVLIASPAELSSELVERSQLMAGG